MGAHPRDSVPSVGGYRRGGDGDASALPEVSMIDTFLREDYSDDETAMLAIVML